MRRALKLITAVVLVAIVTPVTASGVVLAANLFLPLPANLPERTPPAPSQISRIYDIEGNEIGTFKQFETSIPVKIEDIPPVLKQAVIAAEDRRFYSHGGVDLHGTMRALIADIRGRDLSQGGSTITQQLVKNTLTGNERSISRKIREAVLASQLDRQMDKDKILFEYLSVIYLGEGAYGVGAASETYFHKPVSQLTLSEAALLAAVIPAPSRFSPRVDPAAAEIRRLSVLGAMLDEGMIDQIQHDDAAAQPVWLTAVGPPPGPATLVFPPETQQSTDPYFTDYVGRWLKVHLPGGEDQIFQGGLRIETTIDPDAQAAARKVVADFLDETDRVNYALGRVSGGGVGGGGSGRQPGSAFKPFVLAQALASGITPSTTYSGRPHDVTKACSPDTPTVLDNYEGAGFGTVDLRTATWKSVNTVYTRLILDVGVDKTIGVAKAMGLTGVRDYDGTIHCASVALGAESVSPLDMASAYGVFAARGLRAEPTPVLRVTDRAGNVIIDNAKPTTTRVLEQPVADNVTGILQGVLTSGTATGRGLDRPAAGKTGTTQNNRDAWFAGYTPTLSTAVWIGYENKTAETAKELVRIKGVAKVTGGTHPARLWQAFMKQALEDVPITEFSEPAPIRSVPDAKLREARRGFEPGKRKYPTGNPTGGSYIVDPGTPEADAPTTTTTSPPSSTTSTTDPDDTTTTTDGGIIN